MRSNASLVGPLLKRIDRPISAVFADGAYDGEPIYRSVGEVAMLRYKVLIGRSLHARTLPKRGQS